jgi:hypothetical protein
MAAKSGSSTSNKKTFGVRKKGKSQKSFNKHSRKIKKYRGQGR